MLARFFELKSRSFRKYQVSAFKNKCLTGGLLTLTLMVLVGRDGLAAPLALHDASRKGDLKAVQQILESGVDINLRDLTGFTPLHWAAMNNQMEVAGFLIKKGADINARESKYNLSPLDIARTRKIKEMEQLLLKNGAKSLDPQRPCNATSDHCQPEPR